MKYNENDLNVFTWLFGGVVALRGVLPTAARGTRRSAQSHSESSAKSIHFFIHQIASKKNCRHIHFAGESNDANSI